MSDNAQVDGGDSQTSGPSADWVTQAAARVRQGLPLDNSGQWDPANGKFGIPAGYDIEDGHLSQNSGNLRAWIQGLIQTATTAAGGALAGGAGGPSGSIPSAFGNTAVDTVSGAAPVVGGSTSTLDSILKAAPALADIFGKAGASDVAQSNTSDQIKIALQNAGVNAKKLAVTAPGERLATGERAALAKVATPAQVHWNGPGSGLRGEVPTYTGGIKSIYDANQVPDMKALSDQVLHDSLVGQMQGGPSGGNQDASLGSAANAGQGSTAGDVLGGIGMGTSVIAALNKLGIFGKGPTPDMAPIPGMSDAIGAG